MALPVEFGTVTLAGKYVDLSGAAARGQVTFTAPAMLTAAASDTFVVPKPFVVTLDVDGAFTVVLPATDDPDISPTFTYRVQESFSSPTSDAGRTFYINIPFDTVGTLQLADLAPVASLTQYTNYVLGVNNLADVDDADEARANIGAERDFQFNVKDYGAIGDGTTDDYASIMLAINAAYAAGGGVVHFPKGTYKSTSVITMPDTAHATKPQTVPIKLTGVGPQWTGRNSITTTGGSVLNVTATDMYGKLRTKGIGWLGVEGLTFTDTAGTTTPFLYTTNTALHVENCAFIGSKDGTACDQDAIICGGTNPHETTGGPTAGADWNDGFQGYATRIVGNYFNHIRRAVYGRTYFNGNIIRDNTIWLQCGNSAGGAIVLNGSAVSGSNFAVGNLISGNLIEVGNYKYGIDIEWGSQNALMFNQMYDATGTTLYGIRLQANTRTNFVIDGLNTKGITDLADASYPNVYLSATQGVVNQLGPVSILDSNYTSTINRLLVTGSGSGAFRIQPVVASSEAGALIEVKRSAAESSSPGENVFELRQRGDIVMRGSQAGNIAFQDSTGAAFSSFTGAGRNWNADGVGGNMQINSGTGGSYLTLRNFGVKLTLQDGTNTVTIKQGTNTPEGNLAANVGSLFLRTDGGAGTTLYIKESGSGNTGWIAK